MNKNSGSGQKLSSSDHNIIDVANYLYSHLTFIIVAAISSAAIVTAWSSAFSRPEYGSSATIIYNVSAENPLESDIGNAYWSKQAEIEKKLYVLNVNLGSSKFKDGIASEVLGKSFLTAKNPEAAKAIAEIQKFAEKLNLKTTAQLGDYLSDLFSSSIDTQKRLVRIEVKSPYPELSQALASLAAHYLIELNFELSLKEINSVLAFINEQTELTRIRLSELEDELVQIQQREKILSASEASLKLDTLKGENYDALTKLEVDQLANRMWISQLEKSIADFSANLKTGTDSHLYMVQISKRLELLQYQKAIRQSDRKIASVDRGDLDRSLQKTQTEFKNALDAKGAKTVTISPWEFLKSLQEKLVAAQQRQSQLDAQVRAFEKLSQRSVSLYHNMPLVLKRVSQIKRNIDITGTLYQQLKSRLQEAQIKKAGMVNDLEILRNATFSRQPIGLVLWKKTLLALLGGIASILVILTLRYIFLPTIRGRSDLINVGAEVLAEIPFAKVGPSEVNVNTKFPLLLKWQPNSDEANAIRHARFTLEERLGLDLVRNTHETKIITICSANSLEGKSFVSSNLAFALAATQFRVLVIDLDLLNSNIRRYFPDATEVSAEAHSPLEKQIGFRKSKINDFLEIVETPVRKSPMEILETPLVGKYLESLKGQYDIVIVDTPPLTNNLEALITSRFSSCMIFVTNQRWSLRHDSFKALDLVRSTYQGQLFSILNCAYDEIKWRRKKIAS